MYLLVCVLSMFVIHVYSIIYALLTFCLACPKGKTTFGDGHADGSRGCGVSGLKGRQLPASRGGPLQLDIVDTGKAWKYKNN